MSRKRRMFEIEMPEDNDPAGTFPAGKADRPAPAAPRRGPMAAAITETAESSRDRARIAAGIRAENDALAQEHVRLKRAGLITDLIPLEAIDTHKLIRDRAKGGDFELAELVASIRDIGLSNPIRVEPAAEGRYELIQGWRRLSAYRALLEETGDAETWGRIPAGIAARGDGLDQLYRRMVDENIVRKDISFAEMAQLAVHYAMDPATEEHDAEKAVAILFKSAGYQKRSYIRSFVFLLDELDTALKFPKAVARNLGVEVARRLQGAPDLAPALRAHRAQLEAVLATGADDPGPRGRARVPGRPAAALDAVRDREETARRRLVDLAVDAESGALARLVAAVCAGVSQQQVLLGEASPADGAR